MMSSSNLNERIVVITGAGSGLGRALARTFSSAGSVVIGMGRSESSLQQTSDLIVDGKFHYRVVDVADAMSVKSSFEDVISKFGRVDILFNNAAVYPKTNFLEQDINDWAQAVTTNLIGVAYCCRAVLPSMIDNGFGRVFNVGSFADGNPIANSSAYAASKGGVHGLTKAVAEDIAQFSVNLEIHEWIPGHLQTKMSDFTGIDPMVSASWGVKIASEARESHHSRLFVNDSEHVPPKRLKERLLDLMLFRS